MLRSLGVDDIRVFDPDAGQVDRLLAEVPGVAVSGSFEAALAEKPDTVFILTPPAMHIPMSIDALRAGCHVFSEKPLADSLERFDDLANIVKETGRKMMVGLCFRFHDGLVRAKRLLESGRIGPCWFDAGRLPRSVVPDVKRSGQYALQLGNPLYQDRGGCPVGEAAVYQLADVPASGHAQLHVWYRIFSNDTVDFDYFGISTAAWPEGEMELRHHDGCTNWTGTLWDSGWREAVITLDNYREQTIIVKLYNAMTNADGWYNTWTVVDDMRVVWVP